MKKQIINDVIDQLENILESLKNVSILMEKQKEIKDFDEQFLTVQNIKIFLEENVLKQALQNTITTEINDSLFNLLYAFSELYTANKGYHDKLGDKKEFNNMLKDIYEANKNVNE